MITDAFDDKSPAKINVKRNENAIPVDAVIFTFSQEIEKYVVASYDCEKVGEFLMACGSTSVYLLKYHGKRFGFYRTWVGAPACVAPIEELSTVLDTDYLVYHEKFGVGTKKYKRALELNKNKGKNIRFIPFKWSCRCLRCNSRKIEHRLNQNIECNQKYNTCRSYFKLFILLIY